MVRRDFNEPCCSNGSQTNSSTLYRRFKILRLQGHIDVVVADMHAIATLTFLSTYNIYCVGYQWNVNVVFSARTPWLDATNISHSSSPQRFLKRTLRYRRPTKYKKFSHCKQTRVSIHLRSKSTRIRIKRIWKRWAHRVRRIAYSG